MNMTTGKWIPKKGVNKEMIVRLRKQWQMLRGRRNIDICIIHVRSHTRLPGNELADFMANRGAHMPTHCEDDTRAARTWIRSWRADT
jgi:ribonuclease HI